MSYKIPQGRLRPKKEATFGKKPFKGKAKNRKGSLKSSFLTSPVKKRVLKIDRDYLSWLQNSSYACMVCGGFVGIEWHHVKRDSTDKKDHTRLIPLCGVECHRLGTELSAHGTPRKFRAVYPIEIQRKYAAEIYGDYKKEEL